MRLRREFERHEFREAARHGIQLTEAALGYRPYHPLFGLREDDRDVVSPGKRPVEPRWNLIEPHLPSSGSAMDIGSQHGWYTFKLAEHGLTALGVEAEEPDMRLAQWLTIYNRAERASFTLLKVTPESVATLPTVDVVVCMSVFHHWARLQGQDHAEAILAGLAERCRDRLFFETGHPGETDRKWNERLAFMQADPIAWSEGLLRRLGFADVRHLGDTRSGKAKKHKNRSLMLAVK